MKQTTKDLFFFIQLN